MLAVGDSTRLEIVFSTDKFNRIVTKKPLITTNPDSTYHNVTIKAIVTAKPDSLYPLTLDPYMLKMNRYNDSTKIGQYAEFTITNPSDSSVTLEIVAMPAELITVDLSLTLEPGQTDTALVTILDEALTLSFDKSFTFELSDDVRSRITVPIKRYVF